MLQVMSTASCMRLPLVDKRLAGAPDNFQPLPTGKSFVSLLLHLLSLSSFSLPCLPSLSGKKTNIPLCVALLLCLIRQPSVQTVSPVAAMIYGIITSGYGVIDADETFGSPFAFNPHAISSNN